MAYTIEFQKSDFAKRDKILAYLQARLIKDGRFKATLTPTTTFKRGGDVLPAIRVKPVRLINKKPYCGNHPGPCELDGKKKPKATFLEWNDWVAFHSLVNKALNRFRANANVWSTPMDVRGKMWIRKGTQARQRYDYSEELSSYGRVIRVWNQGTSDQFEAA